MPTFNVITATPTNSIGGSRLSPEHETVINNNNIIIQSAVVSDVEADSKIQKLSDNFEDTCATEATCPEKPKMM